MSELAAAANDLNAADGHLLRLEQIVDGAELEARNEDLAQIHAALKRQQRALRLLLEHEARKQVP